MIRQSKVSFFTRKERRMDGPVFNNVTIKQDYILSTIYTLNESFIEIVYIISLLLFLPTLITTQLLAEHCKRQTYYWLISINVYVWIY